MSFDWTTSGELIDELAALDAGAPRGKALEALVAKIFGELPGVDVAVRNDLAASGVEEVDILFVNQGLQNGLPGFHRDVLVECKSQAKPLNSRSVNWFASQLRRRHLPMGVLVCLAGITGNPESVTAAHREIERCAGEGQQILILVDAELRGVRSAAHLAALLECKRTRMVSGFHPYVADSNALRELDPNPPGGVQVLHGVEAFRKAVRRMQRDALDEILHRATEDAEIPFHDAVSLVGRRMGDLADEVERHTACREHDPLWRVAREHVIAVGAAFAGLLEPRPMTEGARRVLWFNVEATTPPQRLRASVGGELWALLTDYYLRETVRNPPGFREASVEAVLALCVDQMLSIDDIDPRDVFDDYEDP
jgi:hypothetical protein